VESRFNRRAPGNGVAYSLQVTNLMNALQDGLLSPATYRLPSNGFLYDGIEQNMKCERGNNNRNPLVTTF
jgi:hypothetical protein